ncbi:2-hydroxyacid dehydrogenase [Oligoflexia bacterium]|nr:2-hydroxyacid dehydrogenase [Oligoflexia bacterium]
MDSCLILNDRDPIPEDALVSLSARLDINWFQRLPDQFSIDEAISGFSYTNYLVTTYADLTAERLGRLEQLKGIVTTTTATEYIDLDYCRSKGISVSNTPKYTGSSVAEHLFALLLGSARQVPTLNQRTHQGDFDCFDVLGVELSGKKLGIIGFGDIGSTVGKIAKGFGLEVMFFNRSDKAGDGTQVPLAKLLKECDFIAVTIPLNDESRGLLGVPEFELMQPSARLVSISPDAVIDRDALAAALRSGAIAGAALDLLGVDPYYLELPNLVLSCRRAWFTAECFARRIEYWRNTLESHLEGDPKNIVV